jgi:hypothetical protein
MDARPIPTGVKLLSFSIVHLYRTVMLAIRAGTNKEE